jgi:hypothetical protein
VIDVPASPPTTSYTVALDASALAGSIVAVNTFTLDSAQAVLSLRGGGLVVQSDANLNAGAVLFEGPAASITAARVRY